MNQENLNNPEEQQETPEQAEISRQLKEMAESSEQPQAKPSHGKKMSGFRKFVSTVVMGSSLLATGCNNEKSSVEKLDPQKVESKDGFTDNVHNNVKQRLNIKKAEIKRMHDNSRIGK